MSDQKYVVFQVAEEFFGLPIERVEQILTDQAVTRVPRTPKMVQGIFELRGKTIASVDLRTRFDFAPRTEPGNMVVATTPAGWVAFRVDKVDGICEFTEESTEESPRLVAEIDDRFMTGVGKNNGKLVVLLDADQLLTNEVEKSIKKHVQAAA